MARIKDLFETHLTVSDLKRSMEFYGERLGLELARQFYERRVAFYWVGHPGQAMLGLWEVGTTPQRLNLHTAFTVELDDVLAGTQLLRNAGILPEDFWGQEAYEPVVLAWMPAAAICFTDPDGNVLEWIRHVAEPAKAGTGCNQLEPMGESKRPRVGSESLGSLAGHETTVLERMRTMRRFALMFGAAVLALAAIAGRAQTAEKKTLTLDRAERVIAAACADIRLHAACRWSRV
jgi:lactoylglutathione lyase